VGFGAAGLGTHRVQHKADHRETLTFLCKDRPPARPKPENFRVKHRTLLHFAGDNKGRIPWRPVKVIPSWARLKFISVTERPTWRIPIPLPCTEQRYFWRKYFSHSARSSKHGILNQEPMLQSPGLYPHTLSSRFWNLKKVHQTVPDNAKP
jgi:hypothetical protein